MSRTFCIGDVHGCYDEMIELVEYIGLRDEDHLYFVGDLINKGPKSLEVIEWIRSRPNTWSVTGNHEYFSLMSGEDHDEHSDGTIEWKNRQYSQSSDLRSELEKRGHLDWLLSLPTMIDREDFLLVHAGLHPEYGLQTPVEWATIIRDHIDHRPWYESYTGSKRIIYGHWAAQGLRIRPNTIGIDTGCVFGGHLTAYRVETGELWQVRAHVVYKSPGHWKTEKEI